MRDHVEIISTLDGYWILLVNGYQKGGTIDAQGAGNAVFREQKDAHDYYEEVLK